MTRARRAASARPRPDRTRASRSDRWSVVSTSDVDGMRHHMIYNSLVQATSTTLLDPKLNFLKFLNPFQIVRILCQQQRGENLGDNRAPRGQRERGIDIVSQPLALSEGVRDCDKHHVCSQPGNDRPSKWSSPSSVLSS